jgi:lysophospholipase L1-like esterase
VPAGSALFGWMRQLLLVLAALAALLLGRVALRAASDRRTIGAATLGMALAAPFAVDGLLVPLPWLLASAAARRAVFLAASVLVLLLVARSALAALDRLPPLPPSPRRAWLARITTRLAFALLALAAAWGVAEWALGAAGLGDRAWSRPMLFIPGDERSVPLSEVALFRPFDAPAAAQGLSTRWRPYLFIKGWYDRPRWKYFDAHGQVDYAFDEYGLRDHDFALEKAPGEFRVVAIGDSFTFGIGVQLEDCWTEVAERELRTRRGGPVEVINAGFSSGYKASDYEDWILHSGVRLKPDVVVVGFCLNDMHDGISLYAWDSPPRVEQWCGGASRVLNAFKGALDGPTPRQRTMEYTGLLKAEPQQWLADQASLRRVNAALAAQGIRLVVLPFPMFSGLREQPYPYKPLLDMVAAFCDRAGIEHVDLLPRVLGLVDEDLWVHPTDQHPNDVGHRLIGEGLADYLEPK